MIVNPVIHSVYRLLFLRARIMAPMRNGRTVFLPTRGKA